MKLGYVILYVNNIEETMAFYEKAFDLKRGFMSDGKEYGEMLTGEVKLGFVSHSLVETYGFSYEKATLSENPPPHEIAFTTKEVEQAFAHAVHCGAKELNKPVKKPWGQTVALVRDINGFIVEISSPL